MGTCLLFLLAMFLLYLALFLKMTIQVVSTSTEILHAESGELDGDGVLVGRSIGFSEKLLVEHERLFDRSAFTGGLHHSYHIFFFHFGHMAVDGGTGDIGTYVAQVVDHGFMSVVQSQYQTLFQRVQ